MKCMKGDALLNYSRERQLLSVDQIYSIIDQGVELASRINLVHCLMEGGCALFPHTYITKCGDQVAAVAYSSLMASQKSGKKRILLIGVLHPLIDSLIKAREREINGIDISRDPCRGFFGPGLSNEELLIKEFSLDNFIFLLEHIAKRNRINIPEVIIRYPNLLYGHPEQVESANELKLLAKDCVIVATSDLCHHGVAYGMSLKNALAISKEATDFASREIKEGLSFLSGNDLLAYRQYAINHFSDSLEVGQMLRFLLGALEGSICDLKLVDVSDLFEENPQPSWVAAALVKLNPKK